VKWKVESARRRLEKCQKTLKIFAFDFAATSIYRRKNHAGGGSTTDTV
jgi:hypothetical protein